jgi:hypothetical protein
MALTGRGVHELSARQRLVLDLAYLVPSLAVVALIALSLDNLRDPSGFVIGFGGVYLAADLFRYWSRSRSAKADR